MAHSTDDNQQYIVDALRSIGATVQSIHRVGYGAPDLIVGYRGKNWLFEVKNEHGHLNIRQQEWHKNWRGQVTVIKTPDEAIDIITMEDD